MTRLRAVLDALVKIGTCIDATKAPLLKAIYFKGIQEHPVYDHIYMEKAMIELTDKKEKYPPIPEEGMVNFTPGVSYFQRDEPPAPPMREVIQEPTNATDNYSLVIAKEIKKLFKLRDFIFPPTEMTKKHVKLLISTPRRLEGEYLLFLYFLFYCSVSNVC